MFCSKCGATVPDSSTACPQCGAQTTPQPSLQNYGQPLSEVPTEGKATTSMILGILSLVCLGIFAGIPAIILGHMSRSNIRKSAGRLKGDGMALAGMIMGYFSVASSVIAIFIIAAIAIPNILRAHIVTNESSALHAIRTLNSAESSYQVANQGYAADIATLGADAGTVADNCTGNWCTKNGYRFTIQADEKQPHESYVITAIPVQPDRTGRNNFCSGVDGVVRTEPANSGHMTPYTAEECAALTPFSYP